MALCSLLPSLSSGHSGGPTVTAQQYCSLMLCLNTLPFLKYHFIFIYAVMQTAVIRLFISLPILLLFPGEKQMPVFAT